MKHVLSKGHKVPISGVGEGGAGGGGGNCPPTLGHDCTLKYIEEKISSCSKSATCSSYLVSIEAIARLYETTAKQIFASDCTKAVSEHKNTWGACPQTPLEV